MLPRLVYDNLLALFYNFRYYILNILDIELRSYKKWWYHCLDNLCQQDHQHIPVALLWRYQHCIKSEVSCGFGLIY